MKWAFKGYVFQTILCVAICGFFLACSKNSNNALSTATPPTDTPLSVGPQIVSLHAGAPAAFFPSGGLAPYTYSVSGGGTITPKTNTAGESFGAYVAPSGAATVTITVQDSLGKQAQAAATVTASQLVSVILPATPSAGGTVYEFTFDPGANTFSNLVTAGPTTMSVLRSMALLPDGQFLLGDASTTTTQLVTSGMTLGSSLNLTGSPLTGAHGLCALPNGDIIAGDENNATSNTIAEFTSAGAYVRTVYLPGSDEINANNPGMSNCIPLGNDDLLFLESPTWSVTMGDVVNVHLSDNQWTVAQRFSATTFDTSQSTSNTGIWQGVAHTDGNLYFPSANQTGTEVPKIISCPLSNINTPNCAQVGTQDLPQGSGFYYGVSQIPGSNDMVVESSHILYRYNYSAGTLTELCDVNDSTSACYIGTDVYLRGMILQ